jgi:hypothetical protein
VAVEAAVLVVWCSGRPWWWRRVAEAGGGGAASTVSSMEIINLLLAAGVDVNPQLNQRRLQGQGGRFGGSALSFGNDAVAASSCR